jgi:four helix bundle protein
MKRLLSAGTVAAMTFQDWEQGVPEAIRGDSLWLVEAYRLGLFMSDLAWDDAGLLLKNARTRGTADQLYRAAGKISSNVSEGYSRDTASARATFYEYALGSARETRDWYYKTRRAFTKAVVAHRTDLSTQVIRLTLTMIKTEHRSKRRVSG